jgi:hypothetical protein
MITSDTLIVISKIQIRLLRLTATHDYRLHCFWSGSMGKPFDHQECRPSISSPRICDDIITVVVVLGSLTITIKMPQRSWNEPIRSTAANSLTNEMLSIRACHASNISRCFIVTKPTEETSLCLIAQMPSFAVQRNQSSWESDNFSSSSQPLLLSLGRESIFHTYNVFFDEWTGNILLPIVYKSGTELPRSWESWKTHLVMINLLD